MQQAPNCETIWILIPPHRGELGLTRKWWCCVWRPDWMSIKVWSFLLCGPFVCQMSGTFTLCSTCTLWSSCQALPQLPAEGAVVFLGPPVLTCRGKLAHLSLFHLILLRVLLTCRRAVIYSLRINTKLMVKNASRSSSSSSSLSGIIYSCRAEIRWICVHLLKTWLFLQTY